MPVITRNIDRSIWRDLMLKSGMLTLMDAEARSVVAGIIFITMFRIKEVKTQR